MNLQLYNVYFDISSILIYFIVLVAYLQKKHVNNMQHKLFINLYLCSLLTPITDIIASILIEEHASYGITMGVNTFYNLTKQGTTFFYLVYIISHLEMRKNISNFKKITMCIPGICMVFIILANPFTGWLFTYDNLVYQSQKMRYVTYLVSIFYYYWVIIYVYTNKKWFNRYFPSLIHNSSMLCVIAEIVQLLYPHLLLHSLSVSLMILMLVINLERYGMTIDPITGFAKREHLEKACDRFFYNNSPFKSVLIKFTDHDLLTLNFGPENVELMVTQIQQYLLTFVEKGKAFQLDNRSFVLLVSHDTDCRLLEEQIYDGLIKPQTINNIEIVTDFYVTSVSCPEQINNIVSYIAMIQYFEKMQRPHPGIFNSKEMHFADKVREQQITQAIETGLKDGNFQLYYQPICTAKDRKFVSAEALLRLTDPLLGPISPAEFIPVAEKNGTILDIGYYVIDSVCQFIEEHDMEALGLKYIELNLSAIQCLQQNFISIIDEITKKHNIKPDYLCFEITETASNNAPSVFAENLRLLNERGYMLALDDFGTGYGNLQRMVTSDFHLVKLDKEMTQRLSSEHQLQKIYRRLASMIHGMGSHIVSEGVETQEQYEFARDAGISYIQGYFFSKPLPTQDFCDFLQASQELQPATLLE